MYLRIQVPLPDFWRLWIISLLLLSAFMHGTRLSSSRVLDSTVSSTANTWVTTPEDATDSHHQKKMFKRKTTKDTLFSIYFRIQITKPFLRKKKKRRNMRSVFQKSIQLSQQKGRPHLCQLKKEPDWQTHISFSLHHCCSDGRVSGCRTKTSLTSFKRCSHFGKEEDLQKQSN